MKHITSLAQLPAGITRILPVCLAIGAVLLACACSRNEPAASAAAPASAPAATGPTAGILVPAATTLDTTSSAAATTAAALSAVSPAAMIREVPPEDRLEPVSLDQARLPGGGALLADPTPSATTKKKTDK